MSLSSLADAPLLSKPAGLSIPRSRSLDRSVTKLKEDQAAIDALFQDDAGTQVAKTHAERKEFPPYREPASCAKKLELQSNSGETVPLPALLSLNQQTGDITKKRQPKQDGLFSKTRDASDVLAGFLADSTNDMNSNKLPLLEDVNKDQRKDFKAKWNSYSPQALGGLPTLTYSSHLASASTLSTPDLLEASISPTKTTSNSLSLLTKDENGEPREDGLSLLPDESNKPGNNGAISDNLCYDPSVSFQNVEEETSDFGAYKPSCLSMPGLTQTLQRRHLTKFFPSSETFNEKEIGMSVAEKPDEGPHCSKMVESVSDETALHQLGVPGKNDASDCHVDVFKRNASPVQDSATAVISIDSCCFSSSRESLSREKPACSVELQQSRDENLALRDEIMKIESEKLKVEKELLEKELLFDPHRENQENSEKEEAQKLAEELAFELLTVKQSLSLTEEKIECMTKVHAQEVFFWIIVNREHAVHSESTFYD